ncbi:MAG: energy transducer TonB [Rhodoplanes sp.]|uniref:energy transducer TonB n=1 Tax=Rhodoplanes sp. TaxID=1968906 RepID=UPI0017FBC2A5|nr:energy transducer TonB [Rhodoplanes sp.]NVO13518.1 energy transducer TonB [Rhodoplanes sp.]
MFAPGALSQTAIPVRLSIAAQPLPAALEAYSAAFGRELYYDGALAAGRKSSPVEGMLAADEALRVLLGGTGLFARAIGPNSVTIAPIARRRAAEPTHQTYFAVVQTTVSQALCARPETRPGDADVLVRVWIGPSGRVQRAQMFDGSDVRGNSAVYEAALEGLPIAAPLPADLPQPISIAILALRPGQPTGCAPSATAAAR